MEKPENIDVVASIKSVISVNEMDSLKTLATPAVRRIAMENSIDLKLVDGTGPKKRILKGDVIAFVENGKRKESVTIQSLAPSPKIKESSPPSSYLVNLTAVQKGMFKSMTKALDIPHFGFTDEIVVNAASEFRNSLNKYLALNPSNHAVKKVSYMPIFLKAMSSALLEFPVLNACVVEGNGDPPQLLYRPSHNIGIAMDTKYG